ncbi:MAG: ATP-dependent DNA helicase RecG [Candidatus Yanofskybacteria bacterium RIFCSPLOWO2_02_FULL_45_10]|uniref:ATP-dependent DNA helicase RecG n=1 Tax=Candidatus Yanofskybacteria bacterium RIFCSPLOWO2_02_FULL_45_10 TaxID=1802706 RepID=A0A1F8H695_9BACT|nr:MAG: ATP-dependent DNA helicase RecG [Candidatus Yanofskybacteria bacterium RIFCSPLOWO2_02_FULL_45_10]
MEQLATPVEKLSFVGPRSLARLKELGIRTVRDLLWHFPHRYDDFSNTMPIAEAQKDQVVNLVGYLTKLDNQRTWKKHMTITTAWIEDETDSIRVVWFNQPYLEKNLPLGCRVSLAGKVKLDKHGLFLSSPSYEKLAEGKESTHTGRLVPVYPETAGLTSKYLRFLIKPLLPYIINLPDPLPQEIREKYRLPTLGKALATIHFPADLITAQQAKRRLAFDELFMFQLRSVINRRRNLLLAAPRLKFDPATVKALVDQLPFQLTNDQRRATFEILKDLEKKYPMNRLLNGDVGSGKTVVALLAAYAAAELGWQAVFMAPTEVLAQQHYKTITSLLKATDTTVALLTASTAKQRASDAITEENIPKVMLLKKIASGEIKIVIATQAILQKDVKLSNPALIVLDEQHRFGVAQRAALLKNQKLVPHLLSMTATPIPRTLALTIYGDLDISLIKEKPAERKPIETKVVPSDQRATAHKFIDQEIASGRQVFVICPRIETPELPVVQMDSAKNLKQSSLWAEVKAVTEEYEKLKNEVFPHRRVAMLHGKLKPKEKEQIMHDFKAGHYDLLVSTSVIEVGIDIPNASVMLIENAERFGLAQLHQFRGRVGRSAHQSYCLLINGSGFGGENHRLQALANSNDGFKLAEIDLTLRGPGEFMGTKQSGIPDLAMASLTDLELIKQARLEAKNILKQDPNLVNYSILKERLAEFQRLRHFE